MSAGDTFERPAFFAPPVADGPAPPPVDGVHYDDAQSVGLTVYVVIVCIFASSLGAVLACLVGCVRLAARLCPRAAPAEARPDDGDRAHDDRDASSRKRNRSMGPRRK